MYYHLSDHIYLGQFQEELILLDARADKYTVCFKEFSDLIARILKEKSPSLSPQDQFSIQKLHEGGVLQRKDTPFPYFIDIKSDSYGVSNVDWRLPLGNKKVNMSFAVLKAFFILLKINYFMKWRGFYSTIQLMKKIRSQQSSFEIPQERELRDLANILNKACLIYPTRTKCLEWAMTYVLLALKRGWKCNLEVGVQNYPFFAHAWVECGGRVVMDDQNLREGLTIILNEPFRRLRS